MPRKPHGPTYLLHSTSGQARIRYPGGKTENLGPYDSPESRGLFDQKCAEWYATGGHLPPDPSKQLVVAEVLDRWIAEVAPTYDPGSREPKQFDYATGPLYDLYGKLPVRDFKAKHLEALREHMARLGWSPDVVARRVVRVRTVFRWAEKEGYVSEGRWDHLLTVVARPKGPRRKRESPPAFAAVKAALAHLKGPVRSMVLLQWWSGMRPGEVCNLRSGEIDRQGPCGCWVYRPGSWKNDWRPDEEQEEILLGPKAQAVLRKWVRWDRPEGHVFRPADAYEEQLAERSRKRQGPPRKRRRKRSPKLAPGPCYSAESYSRAVARACERAGVSWHPYLLRHAAKMRIEKAAGTEQARAVLRQRHINTTQLYGQRDFLWAAETMAKLG